MKLVDLYPHYIVEMMLDLNQPESNPAQKVLFNGLEFQRQRKPQSRGSMWFVFKDDQMLGAFIEEFIGSDKLSIHVEIEPEFQRLGHGIKIYQFAQQLAKREGRTLVPGQLQTPAAKQFWKKYSDRLNP